MRFASLFGVLTGLSMSWSWTVARADDPNPQQALNEARTLAGAGKYEESLAKHFWFHKNALATEPSLSGVRLSFALTDWVKLGKKYPPARDALVAIRDDDARAFEEGRGSFELFHDLSSIDGYLDDRPRTIATFKVVAAKDRKLAETCYIVAEKELLAARDFATCGEFIPDSIARLDRITANREGLVKFAAQGHPQMRQVAEDNFVEEVVRVIKILEGAGRRPEALEVRNRAILVRDVPAIRGAIDAPVQGPRPLPAADVAIRTLLDRFAEAIEARDQAVLLTCVAPDADLIGAEGTWRKGRDDLIQGILELVPKNSARRTIAVESLRLLTSDVVLADGRFRHEGGSDRDWIMITLRQSSEGWKIAAIRTMLAPVPPAR